MLFRRNTISTVGFRSWPSQRNHITNKPSTYLQRYVYTYIQTQSRYCYKLTLSLLAEVCIYVYIDSVKILLQTDPQLTCRSYIHTAVHTNSLKKKLCRNLLAKDIIWTYVMTCSKLVPTILPLETAIKLYMFSPEIRSIFHNMFSQVKTFSNFQFYLRHFLQLFVNTRRLFTKTPVVCPHSYIYRCRVGFSIQFHVLVWVFGSYDYTKGLDFRCYILYRIELAPSKY